MSFTFCDFLLVYELVNYFSDITDKSSFERAKFWVNELKTYEDVSIKFM